MEHPPGCYKNYPSVCRMGIVPRTLEFSGPQSAAFPSRETGPNRHPREANVWRMRESPIMISRRPEKHVSKPCALHGWRLQPSGLKTCMQTRQNTSEVPTFVLRSSINMLVSCPTSFIWLDNKVMSASSFQKQSIHHTASEDRHQVVEVNLTYVPKNI